jgi:hypothetical protein
MNKGRKMNPNSAKFISLVMNFSEEEAKSWIRNNNSSPFYRENFSTQEEYFASQTRDLDWHKKKYGEDLGVKKFEDLIRKQNHSRSLSGYVDRYGPLGALKYQKTQKRKDSMTLDSFRLRNPHLDEEKIIEAWIQRVKSVGLTKDLFIKKHGIKKFLDCIRSRQKGRSFVSKWSLGLIDEIVQNLLKDVQVTEIRYGIGREICIHDLEKSRSYYYDLLVRIPNKNLIVEFNGRKFHADPRLLPNERLSWKNPFNPNLTWEESHKYEEQKIKTATQSGFEVLVVWDYESKEQIFKKVQEFICGK